MSALSDAARAVVRAQAAVVRELTSPTEWVTGEHGASDREAARVVGALIAAVRHHDAEIAREFAEQEDSHLTTLCATTYVQGIRDTAARIDPKEGE